VDAVKEKGVGKTANKPENMTTIKELCT